MRTTTKVHFITEGAEIYDPTTGNYITSEDTRDLQWAHVTDTGEERMSLLYGAIKQGAKTVRLNRGYDKPFDFIEIDGKLYKDQLNKEVNRRRVFEVVGK